MKVLLILIEKVYMKIPVNTKHRLFPDNYKGHIRSYCLENCPEYCKNNDKWKYFDKDNEEWLKDGTMKLTCEG